MVANPQIKLGYEEYKNLLEAETQRYELLEGELIMVPAPVPYHQIICRNLEERLWEFVQKWKLGEVLFAPCDVVLAGSSIVQPDIIFVSRERARRIISHDEIRGAPDLVIEILSPTTAKRDRTTKKTLYARHGVAEYWLADPDTKTIEVLKLTARGYRRAGIYTKKEILLSPLLPGLAISLRKVF
jgi:Uma2 family endonuclease